MILLFDSSAPTCQLWVVDQDGRELLSDSWEAGRELSKGIFTYFDDCFGRLGADWRAVDGIVVYRGPGSFTGLRIGLTVLNTLAHANGIPIVGEVGEEWRSTGLLRLAAGEDDQLVMPLYGAEANISKPRK